MNTDTMTAHQFLLENIEKGAFSTDDLLAIFLPLLKQVQETHERDKVAPLDGIVKVQVNYRHLWYDLAEEEDAKSNSAKLKSLQNEESRFIEVIAHTEETHDLDTGNVERNILLSDHDEDLKTITYLPLYRSWEHAVEHHDALTDIYSLGILLASFALGVDLGEKEEMERFVHYRDNLFELNKQLHPVVADIIVKMTELNRHKRAQDLPSLTFSLQHYREQTIVESDITESYKGFNEKSLKGRRQIIQNSLRTRLFEISRRNRLIYYKDKSSHLNLTEASVPMLLDYKNIREEQLFLWHKSLQKKLFSENGLDLNEYLRFEEAIYLPSTLDKIRSEANKDIKEYGFAQLRLVLAFLNWHNLKEDKEDRIHSPLLLLSVTLSKKKGVRDQYILKAQSTEAEVNPALKHHLKELYDIDLPESIDLEEAEIDDLYDLLKNQIQQSEKAVQLDKVERPKIELILAKARQRLNSYRKRARLSGKGVRFHGDINYSYSPKNYEPLGLQLFLQRVKPARAPFSNIFDETPTPRQLSISPPESSSKPVVMEKEKEMYRMKEEENNPYSWSLDLCSITLANFNYRKMSLVRDYNQLIEKEEDNKAFDDIFSLDPKDIAKAEKESVNFKDSYLIVPSDRSQMAAVQEAQKGKSYIIQGPPGTGKSQTITNLIADYVARDKRVLFVCEKRAAIDVVYHRLQQSGLDQLACLIHDSQADKKAFVHDLRDTYNGFIETNVDETLAEKQQSLALKLQNALDDLKDFSTVMANSSEDSASAWELLQALMIYPKTEMSENEQDILPSFAFWQSQNEPLEKLTSTLVEYDYQPIYAEFPFKFLKPSLSEEENALTLVHQLADELSQLFTQMDEIKELVPLIEFPENFEDLKSLTEFAQALRPLAERQQLSLLDGNSPLSRQWRQDLKKVDKSKENFDEAQQKCQHWDRELSEEDTQAAYDQAESFEGKFFKFLSPSFWSLRKLLNQSYKFSEHQVKPTWIRILQDLADRYKAEKRQEDILEEIADTYGIDDFSEMDENLKDYRKAIQSDFKQWKEAFTGSDIRYSEWVLKMADFDDKMSSFYDKLCELFHDAEAMDLSSLQSEVKQAKACDRDALYLLGLFYKIPQDAYGALRQLSFSIDQLTYLIADKEYEELCRENSQFKRFHSRKFSDIRERFNKDYKNWQKLNGQLIKHRAQVKFLEHVKISELPNSELNAEQKEFKKTYKAGRRELEREFSKKMRYKAIRSLAADETADVLRDLKPIWLMSPLSVSDTLALSTQEFDVVIFDEASQIQLEEAIPALYRSNQVIVVGDEKQLPPTRFFASSQGEDEELEIEENGELYNYDLNADSFLSQSARNLPSTMLLWHYRSRYEDLIAFSNQAFYQGELLTIPDRQYKDHQLPAIIINDPREADSPADKILERSISYHYLSNGLYEKRRNNSEAVYIAQMIRDLLNKESGMSLGLVAFSEAQQGEIELELERLGREDKTFRNRLEREMEREEEGQFVGLFVKNLENVQGDERDIIILSICYASTLTGKMRMNFGPINKGGGEKRLNVIFSRAKQHMVVVTSIKGERITNTYNDGANCLRNYLEYAEAVSQNKVQEADTILRRLHLSHEQKQEVTEHLAATELAEILRDKGYQVDLNVGRSKFRCQLAVRDQDRYCLGILFDSQEQYNKPDDLENFLLKPQVLGAFDWPHEFILSKDWFSMKEDTCQKVFKRLEK